MVEQGRSDRAAWEGELFRLLIENVRDYAIFVVDPEGIVRTWGHGAERLLGYREEEIVGGTADVFFTPEDVRAGVPQREMRDALSTGRGEDDRWHVRKDGTRFWVSGVLTPLLDESGTVRGFAKIMRDRTEWRQADQARRETEARKAAILEAALDCIITIDHQGMIVEFNPAAERTFGYARSEVLGREMAGLIVPPSMRNAHRTGLSRYLATGEGPVLGRRIEIVGMRADGTEFPVELAVTPIAAGGQPSFTAYLRDITERKRHEAERERLLAEAQEANDAKTQFLAMLSHELRTPLNPILLATSAMLEEPAKPHDFRPTLEMIRQNVNLQARLIDDLLDVMRIVRGKMPLHWEVADAYDIIGQAIHICRSEVLGKSLRLEMDFNAEEHHVSADPARFQQVIWNLLKNAVKFTPDGGAITIRTRNWHGEEGEQLIIEIVDTGIGIEPEVLPTIFDPFQQGETTITRRFGGLGLGLAICKSVVESHGGRLIAESEGQDRGTTFRIVLKTIPGPSVIGGKSLGNMREPAPKTSVSLRILVVEDEPTTLRLMARLLTGLGHDVRTAGTVADALLGAEAGDLDLIISDIGLPDGTGLDLLRRVVARRGPIPAIALTGYGMEEDLVRSQEAGFTTHMTKPIDFTKLEAMIRRIAQ